MFRLDSIIGSTSRVLHFHPTYIRIEIAPEIHFYFPVRRPIRL